MGYDLHITRKEQWHEDEPQNDISLAEWIYYISRDPDIRLDNYAEAELPNGEVLRVESEGLVVWTAYSGERRGEHAWFSYSISSSTIVVKNPCQEIINKMVDIADILKARVQGDEGELYDKNSNVPSREEILRGLARKKKAWWRFW